MSETDSPGKDGLLEEAAAWFARMRGPDAEQSRAEFEKWLARGALHRGAYNRAAEVFAMGKLLAEDEQQDVTRPARAAGYEPRLVFAGITAGLLLVLTTSLIVFYASRPDRREPNALAANSLSAIAQAAEFTTSNAGQSIRLADNSLVRLDRGTSLAVQFGTERRLLLERGSARFYVAHERRPFIVSAGGGYVVAHGTIFDVALGKSRKVTVGLIEGVVEVGAPSLANAPSSVRPKRRLRPGETMSFAAAEVPASAALRQDPAGSAVGPNTAASEPVDFRSVSLAELVRLANHGSSRPIRIADEETGRLRVSGTFRIDDTDVLAQRIAALFGLIIDRTNPAEIVLSAK